MEEKTKNELKYLQDISAKLEIVRQTRYLNLEQDITTYQNLLMDIKSKKDRIIKILEEEK